jgi:hypothetical protein
MKHSHSKISSEHVEPGLGRRSFLRRASLGSVGALAVASVAGVLAAPAASAGTKKARTLRQNAHLTFVEKGQASPKICTGESECHPCSGCCLNGPCKPTGVGFCFFCRGSCGNGTICIDHPPVAFSNCCH